MRPGSVRRLASAAGRKSAKTSSERCDIVASSWTCLDLVEPALRYRGRAEICPGDSPRHGGDRICVPSDGQSMADGVFEGMRRLDEAIDGGRHIGVSMYIVAERIGNFLWLCARRE